MKYADLSDNFLDTAPSLPGYCHPAAVVYQCILKFSRQQQRQQLIDVLPEIKTALHMNRQMLSRCLKWLAAAGYIDYKAQVNGQDAAEITVNVPVKNLNKYPNRYPDKHLTPDLHEDECLLENLTATLTGGITPTLSGDEQAPIIPPRVHTHVSAPAPARAEKDVVNSSLYFNSSTNTISSLEESCRRSSESRELLREAALNDDDDNEKKIGGVVEKKMGGAKIPNPTLDEKTPAQPPQIPPTPLFPSVEADRQRAAQYAAELSDRHPPIDGMVAAVEEVWCHVAGQPLSRGAFEELLHRLYPRTKAEAFAMKYGITVDELLPAFVLSRMNAEFDTKPYVHICLTRFAADVKANPSLLLTESPPADQYALTAYGNQLQPVNHYGQSTRQSTYQPRASRGLSNEERYGDAVSSTFSALQHAFALADAGIISRGES